MIIAFTEHGWEEYLYWQQTDKRKVIRVNELLKAIIRTPFEGIGKPEPLKGNLQGFWSRRIDSEHRIIYKIDNQMIIVIQCRYHY